MPSYGSNPRPSSWRCASRSTGCGPIRWTTSGSSTGRRSPLENGRRVPRPPVGASTTGPARRRAPHDRAGAPQTAPVTQSSGSPPGSASRSHPGSPSRGSFLKSSGQNGMVGRQPFWWCTWCPTREALSISKSASAVEARWTDFDFDRRYAANVGPDVDFEFAHRGRQSHRQRGDSLPRQGRCLVTPEKNKAWSA